MQESEHASNQDSLVRTGLTPHQATLYAALVQKGTVAASKIALEAKLSRPLTYRVLDELIDLGLVEKIDKPRAVAKFNALHPIKLKEMADIRFTAAQEAKAAVDSSLSKLISDYNLQSGKPGVRFFEGLEGVREVLNDSLTARGEIYSYADLESIEKHISEINKQYVREREKRQIKKKGIVVDTSFARNFLRNYAPGVTETKLIKESAVPFQTVMQMYDGKVSYITLSDETMIGVIIADPRICEMHRALFLYTWRTIPDFTPEHSPASQMRNTNDLRFGENE